jgi:hypothetical protein
MPRKYLMLETRDKRKFFTERSNLDQLIEFSKTFGAEISVVKTDDEVEVLDLISLASNLCDTSNSIQKPNFRVLEVKVPNPTRPRRKLLRNSKTIDKWIKNELMSGKIVLLSDLVKKYKRYDLTLGCLCNHFTKTRQELAKEGYTVEKISRGKYRIQGNGM